MLSDDEWQRTLEATAEAIRACTLGRNHATRTRAVPGEGPVPAAVRLIGDAAGPDEGGARADCGGRAGRV